MRIEIMGIAVGAAEECCGIAPLIGRVFDFRPACLLDDCYLRHSAGERAFPVLDIFGEPF